MNRLLWTALLLTAIGILGSLARLHARAEREHGDTYPEAEGTELEGWHRG